MKDKLWQIFFAGFIVVIFLIEGLGVIQGRLLALQLVLIMPFFLFSLDFILGTGVHIPVKSVSLFLIYLIFVAIAVLFGTSVENSYGVLFYYVSLLLIFIAVYNHKNFEAVLIPLLIILGYSFIGYTVFLQLLPESFNYLIPENGYQFVYSKFGSHNHLGDFLVLGILISLYKYIAKKSWFYLITVMLFSVFLLISFSRSAYTSFIISAGLLIFFSWRRKAIKFISFPNIYIGCAALLALVLFFAVVSEARSVPVFRELNVFLEDNFGLKHKTFISRRNEFASFALASFNERPFQGVGIGNFVDISKKMNTAGFITFSSHNIFLDILSESGILALVSFLGCLVYVLFKALKNKGLVFYLLVSMLIVFQTDYVHTIYSFFLLFFILLGLVDSEETVASPSLASILLSVSIGLSLGLFL